MPQRFPRWIGPSISKHWKSAKSALQVAMQHVVASVYAKASSGPAWVENLESRQLLSATYFVSPSGSDNNVGNIHAPFKTIQRAANVAKAGDFVEIETGTYHETVTPKTSGAASAPITFQAYNGENVTITGADPITSFTKYSSTVSVANMPWDLGEGSNQVFADGQVLTEARFPNTSIADYSTPTTDSIQSIKVSGDTATIYDSNLTQAAGYWKGSVIHLGAGQNWVGQTGTVTSSSPGSVTFTFQNAGGYSAPVKGNKYYLVGNFHSLDSSNEFYRDPSGKLYVSSSVASEDIEAKARLYAFDLSSVHDVTVQGINIFAATIKTTGTSKDVVINGITAKYVSQFTLSPTGWWIAPNYGIILDGSGDVLENSTIAYSAGDGVVVDSSNVKVLNNVIHDVDEVGADLAGVRVLTNGDIIQGNTIYNSGRDGILANVSTVQILSNTVYNVGLQTTEPGGIYTVGTKGNNAVIAYNTVYNIHTGGFGGTAIFLDNSTSGWVVHNNVTYNVDFGMKLNFNCNNNSIYNNTLGATKDSISTNGKGNWDGTVISKNVVPLPVLSCPGAKITGDATTATSSAVGAGSVVSGAKGVVSAPPPVTTPPVTTPPVTTPPVTTPPVTKPPVTKPPVTTPPVTTPTVPSAYTSIKAVNYTTQSGTAGDTFGGVGYTNANDYLAYKLDFGTTGAKKLTAQIAAKYAGGSIQIRLGSPKGTLVGTLNIGVTGAWNKYTSQSAAVSGLKGVQTVYLVFEGKTNYGIANVMSLQFS